LFVLKATPTAISSPKIRSGLLKTMLSARGAKWAKMAFPHGALNTYDATTNPTGVVNLSSAENVSLRNTETGFIVSDMRKDER
jgi:hypothetical protein